ncbi:MAG: leucine--tRNA ligase [Alphaproteobacteria bacterium]|nr:leucine--tRNA ligase [Alphaproteobacteria bacterium]
MTYPFKKIEKKWQKKWEENATFEFEDNPSKRKSYILEMFPYPSGKLHMGHVRNYTIGDTIARYLRHKGHNVLHPMGWDAFGLPAENAAIEYNALPKKWTYENIVPMRQQFKNLGFGFAWDREFASCDETYYGQEQKIFLDFYNKGLAYQSESWVNWDPVENTVLANEQVENGRGWRSGALVEKKRLRQWSLKITDYADELLTDLEKLDKWPEKIRKMQENWIGKSKGALIRFRLSSDAILEVFSTRPETLYGASFIAIAPTHPITEALSQNDPALLVFIKECQQMSTAEADLATADKKGYRTELYAIHPLTDEKLPLYVANFVLMDYGTGAVFGCPAHDDRDFDFATKYELSIKHVIDNETTLVNSGNLDGLSVSDARSKAIDLLIQKNVGEKKITFRIRDWGISRQRFWGCPIPMVYCDACGVVPVKEADLPVTLPEDPDFSKPGNPLANHPTWKHTSCPSCGKPAVRETDTFDTFFESSWYFLRFIDPKCKDPINKEASNRLMPVDVYVGGPEHAVMHLLYARFFVKALRDLGYIDHDEPFKELLTQGMVCHQTFKDQNGKWVEPAQVFKEKDGSYILKDGSKVTVGRSEKMAKSKKNVIEPISIIDSYGADTARLFVLSDTPYDKDFDWNENSLDGAWRYLSKVHRLGEMFMEQLKKSSLGTQNSDPKEFERSKEAIDLEKTTHRYIKTMTDAFEKYGFNKAIAFHREFCRTLEEAMAVMGPAHTLFSYRTLLQTLSPIAPHITADLWETLYKHFESVGLPYAELHDVSWPDYIEELAALDEITLAVQVNGKMRGSIQVAPDADESMIKNTAYTLATVQRDMEGKDIRRVIIVPGRIINIVVA